MSSKVSLPQAGSLVIIPTSEWMLSSSTVMLVGVNHSLVKDRESVSSSSWSSSSEIVGTESKQSPGVSVDGYSTDVLVRSQWLQVMWLRL